MLKIRLATHNDATAIMLVRREAIFSKAAAHYDQARLNAWAARDTPDGVARIEQEIADPGFIVLVAEAGDEIIGFAMAFPSENKLRALYVKPNPIGNVGRALLAALEDLAFKATQFLICDASLNAESFYKANGYTEECRIDHVSSPSGIISCIVRMKKHRPNDHHRDLT